MAFILVFDIPRELTTERKQVNLALRRMDARMLQFSVWQHESLNKLLEIASRIKLIGGSATILEEKFIFQ
jgi:CRISPR-associated endonuclease Cas2